MPLCVVQRDLIAWSLRASGYGPISFVYGPSPAVAVGDKSHYYAAECTYLQLLLIVAPFLWVFGASRRRNILRIATVGLVILCANVVRCWAAVYLDVIDVPRFYAHDLPNYLFGSMAVIVPVLALRRDFGNRFEPRARRIPVPATG